MEIASKEARLVLALKALENNKNISLRHAAKVYNVSLATLHHRRAGRVSRCDSSANSKKLTDLEELAIVQHILNLDSKGFPPRRSSVEDMANRLLAERNALRVGVNWATTFIKRRLELTMRFNRKYDYQRALCEDPNAIRACFALVHNTIAKYGILEADIYNFDETGFMMGIIATMMVVTSAERKGKAKSKQPGNRDWATVIQAVNALGWAIPPFIIVKVKNHLTSWYENSPLLED